MFQNRSRGAASRCVHLHKSVISAYAFSSAYMGRHSQTTRQAHRERERQTHTQRQTSTHTDKQTANLQTHTHRQRYTCLLRMHFCTSAPILPLCMHSCAHVCILIQHLPNTKITISIARLGHTHDLNRTCTPFYA